MTAVVIALMAALMLMFMLAIMNAQLVCPVIIVRLVRYDRLRTFIFEIIRMRGDRQAGSE